MFKVKLTAKSKRELKNLSQQDKLRIGEIIEELKEDPLIGKPLARELSKRYSYRVGVYRIIYKINQEDKIVEILSAGHRSIAYN